MTKQTHLYTIDWSLFSPESLPSLYEEYKNSTLADVDRIIAKHKGGTLSIDDLFGEKAYDDSLQTQLRFEPAGHLKGVAETPEFRAVYDDIVQKHTELSVQISLNKDLYQAYKALAQAPESVNYTVEQKKALKDLLLSYELSGVALPEEKKQEWKELSLALTKAQQEFSNNHLDARQAWKKYLPEDQAQRLAGVPEISLGLLKQLAAAEGHADGYLLTLDPPVVQAVLSYCDDRDLREELWRAYAYLASPLDTTKGKFDNTEVAQRIYELKTKKAKLLGYKNHAELSLVTKMAETPEQVLNFLEDLTAKSLDGAKEKFNKIKAYAQSKGLENYELWDVAYYTTKYNIETYNIDDEEFRPYFPANKVFAGLFVVLNKLYSLDFEEDQGVNKYHPDVKFYKVYKNKVVYNFDEVTGALKRDAAGNLVPKLDVNGNVIYERELIAGLYADLYARNGKRSGAWMNQAFGRCETATRVKLPVAYIVGNFQPPVGGKPACLSVNEVTTLFHEMGHALHLLLTRCQVESICGTNVEWDAVELPSQIHENWVYEADALKYISGHVDTGETLPPELLAKLKQSVSLSTDAAFLTRQLQFGLFDMTVFSKSEDDKRTVKQINQEIFDRFNSHITGRTPETYFANTFGHIFAGGYSAGYYSYLWAEVLAADAFAAYLETGDVFNKEVAERFEEKILARGGTYPSLQNYVEFRGREPDNAALLAQYGLKA